MDVRRNIMNIRKKIKSAAQRTGRDPKDIQLVAVTKNVSPKMMEEAASAGINIFGENRVQEAVSKYNKVRKNIDWHMIGHLQSNKAKIAVELFSMIQSLDSVKLAKEIDKRANRIEKVIDVLIQVNIGREETKFGINPEDVEGFIRSIANLPNINVRGLMAIAPYSDNPENVRKYFREMKRIFDYIKSLKIEGINMELLSMGMTGDFEVAIEEGANMVRIGSGIFGKRE